MPQVYVVGPDSRYRAMPTVGCKDQERELQLLLENNLNLLPGEQIRPEDPPRWVLIKREMPVPDPNGTGDRWSIDLLLADQEARPTFVALTRHSDRGVQYLSIRYTERLAESKIKPSVGSVGDSYDNALAESVIGLYKTEIIRRLGPWRNLEAVEFATLEWVDWFNYRRSLKPIGHIPPAEAEAIYYQQFEESTMVA